MRPGLDWLSPAEADFCRGLTVAKRRDDWLLGRWTAKQLVMAVLGNQGHDKPEPRALHIDRAADGAPTVRLDTAPSAMPPVTLSLSHSHGVAVAALVLAANWPLGIDLEWCEARHPAMAGDYFTAVEQADLAALPATQHTTAVTAIWSGKEAALKAVRLGLSQDTRALSVRFPAQPDAPAVWSPFVITWDEQRLAGPPLEGWWRVWNGYVLTVACHPSPNKPLSD